MITAAELREMASRLDPYSNDAQPTFLGCAAALDAKDALLKDCEEHIKRGLALNDIRERVYAAVEEDLAKARARIAELEAEADGYRDELDKCARGEPTPDVLGLRARVEELVGALRTAERRGEKAAFEMAASRLLDFEMPLGAVACIRALAKERTGR